MYRIGFYFLKVKRLEYRNYYSFLYLDLFLFHCFSCVVIDFLFDLLDQGSPNFKLLAKTTLLPVSINKFVLEHSQTHLCVYYLWLLSCYDGKVGQFQPRPYGSQSQKYFLTWPLQEVCQLLLQTTYFVLGSEYSLSVSYQILKLLKNVNYISKLKEKNVWIQGI